MKAKCPGCRHLWARHDETGCRASYSAGPSGSFQCSCRRKPPAVKKPKQKTRNWRCQAERDGKRCKTRALIESRRKVGTPTFKVPVKLKLCSPCDREFSVLLGGQFDARATV